MAGKVINVEEVLEGQRFGAFSLRVLVLALLALIADGYDVQVMAFSAPSLLKEWGLQRAAFGPVLSAGLFGILFGAPLFGWLGDRIGRKRCIIASSLLYGVFCLACLLATNIETLVALRFLTGVGLGGVMPNAIAIATELSPKKSRAAMASVIAVGITIGGVVPGLIAAHMHHGVSVWRHLFLVGGIAPFVIALLIAVSLPESVAFLVQRGAPREKIARLLRQVDPRLDIPADAEFSVRPAEARVSSGFGPLFSGELKLVTPLLWLMFASTLLTIYLLTSWMPLLLEASGYTPARAAETNSLFQAGGALGCVAAALLLGRLGPPLVVGLFLLTLASVAAVARADLGALLPLGVAACGFCLVGLQGTLNGTAGLAYPTAARSKGVGMALGVGRIGSVIGPLVGGQMVAAGVTSARDLFLLPLLPLTAGAAAAVVVAWRLTRRTPGPA